MINYRGRFIFWGLKKYNVKGPHYEKEFKMTRYMILEDVCASESP